MFALAVALLLDFALGDLQTRWHPVRVLEHVADTVGMFCRGLDASAKVQGAVFLAASVCLFVFSASFILLVVSFSRPLYILTDGVMIYFALGGTRIAREVSGVADAFLREGAAGARVRLGSLTGLDTGGMGEEEIASGAIETLAEKFSDSVCATLFYAAIGGAPLAWVHRVASTLGGAAGYKTDGRSAFEWASARLDDILNYLPARISAVIIAVVSPAVSGSADATLEGAKRDGEAHESLNSGYPVAAFAGALGVKLCGPASYSGTLEEKPFAGTGTRPRIADVLRALCLYWNAYALAAVAAIALGGIMR